MGDVLYNPRLQAARKFLTANDADIGLKAELYMFTKSWQNMNGIQRKICVRHIVSQVASEYELVRTLRKELGIKCASIVWWLPEPDNQAGVEARMLLKGMGGCVSKNGACVMITTANDQF